MKTTQNKQLIALREKAGYSQKRLAELSGVHRVSITKFESGRRKMGLYCAYKLAKVLNVDPSVLLSEKNLPDNVVNA